MFPSARGVACKDQLVEEPMVEKEDVVCRMLQPMEIPHRPWAGAVACEEE